MEEQFKFHKEIIMEIALSDLDQKLRRLKDSMKSFQTEAYKHRLTGTFLEWETAGALEDTLYLKGTIADLSCESEFGDFWCDMLEVFVEIKLKFVIKDTLIILMPDPDRSKAAEVKNLTELRCGSGRRAGLEQNRFITAKIMDSWIQTKIGKAAIRLAELDRKQYLKKVPGQAGSGTEHLDYFFRSTGLPQKALLQIFRCPSQDWSHTQESVAETYR